MCETMNILKRDTKPSTNYSLQDIWKGSGARWRESMIQLLIAGLIKTYGE